MIILVSISKIFKYLRCYCLFYVKKRKTTERTNLAVIFIRIYEFVTRL